MWCEVDDVSNSKDSASSQRTRKRWWNGWWFMGGEDVVKEKRFQNFLADRVKRCA